MVFRFSARVGGIQIEYFWDRNSESSKIFGRPGAITWLGAHGIKTSFFWGLCGGLSRFRDDCVPQPA
jgi:hypothetical protein